MSLSDKSDIKGYVPVNDKLCELLTAFTAHVSEKDSHENEWLELCYFFSHYGSGEPYGNPIIGLTDETAIEITEGKTITADLTKLIPPFPITIYSFTPEQSGVYKFESFISEDLAGDYGAQIWIYTDDIDNPLIYNGDDRLHRGGKNEQNFLSYIYLKKGETYYVAVALLMAETGTYDFSVSYYGESITILDCCASGDYTLTENGEMKLRDAVKYGKDKDGYYHVLNKDGTLGEFIYMDFKYSSKGHIYYSLSDIINQYIMDPVNVSEKLFKVFDFTQAVSYYVTGYTEDGNEIYSYDVIDLTRREDPKYKDYTDRMKELCAEAMKNDGLLKVTDELVDIMSLYFPLRTDAIYEDIIAASRENEWLKFCYYYKTIDENNPV